MKVYLSFNDVVVVDHGKSLFTLSLEEAIEMRNKVDKLIKQLNDIEKITFREVDQYDLNTQKVFTVFTCPNDFYYGGGINFDYFCQGDTHEQALEHFKKGFIGTLKANLMRFGNYDRPMNEIGDMHPTREEEVFDEILNKLDQKFYVMELLDVNNQ